MNNANALQSTSISMVNTTDVPEDDVENNGREITRMLHLVIRPFLILIPPEIHCRSWSCAEDL